MKVVIKVDLNIEGTNLSKGGEFVVYREDLIPEFALDWIRKIKRETGYRKTNIVKVLYNGNVDITDKVKELESKEIPDLPFNW